MHALGGHLIITADDWGYSPRYNAGILEAARAGAVDAVGAMVLRSACKPAPLLECGVEVGLHLELASAPGDQVDSFAELFGRTPAYLDGHRHCHATPPMAEAVDELALDLGIPVRPASGEHRALLRKRGIAVADRTIGRMDEREPAMPDELTMALRIGELPGGTTEWIVHPGTRDPESGSSYDRGREEDLELLLRLAEDPVLGAARGTHGELLSPPVQGPR